MQNAPEKSVKSFSFARPPQWFLGAELVGTFFSIPLILAEIQDLRLVMHLSLWGFALYCFIALHHNEKLSWNTLWHGQAWSWGGKKQSIIRFILLAPVIIGFSWLLVPERFFTFPLERPWIWLLVMILYPILSVIPQELIYRSFFFERYARLIPNMNLRIIISAYAFGFSHIIFHNMIAPIFCAIGGFIFARSYAKHRSLKWAVIEHSLYGCLIFTSGLGWFFFAHL